MTPKNFLEQHPQMEARQKLKSLVEVLTGPGGCPWDQGQTAETIIDFVIDEAHELKAGLKEKDPDEIASEFGDLLFTVQFLTHSLRDQVSAEDASTRLVEKMIRRHPHVFDQKSFADEGELKLNWEAEKRKENTSRERFDQDIPASLPPLEKSRKVLSRASNAGFRYQREEDAWDKIWEEVFELETAETKPEFEQELGDLFLALLTLARMKGANATSGLDAATKKLCDRLQQVERLAGKPLNDIPYSQLRGLYLRGKGENSRESAFFNYCGVSPWPREVRQGVHRATQRIVKEGLVAALALRAERETLRDEIAAFCGAPAESSVVFVPNVSMAATGVAYCLQWEPGDRVLLGKGEFPANTAPWVAAADTFETEVTWWDDDLLRTDPDLGYQQLEELLAKDRPRLMAISAVSFWSGYRFSLDKLSALCQKYGVRLYVDAIQALGASPLSMGRVDFLACGSHKALLSPEGAGFLIVRPEAASEWVPRLYSWLSLPEPVDFLVTGQPGRIPNGARPRHGDPVTLEGGSVNCLGYAGLRASIALLGSLTPESVFEHVQGLQDELEQVLVALGWSSLRAADPGHRSTILSFDPPPGLDLASFQQKLAQRAISTGIPNGRLRFGFHWFNTKEDVALAGQVCSDLMLGAETG
jgi:cysteine desulfurase/selenocysteine lyase